MTSRILGVRFESFVRVGTLTVTSKSTLALNTAARQQIHLIPTAIAPHLGQGLTDCAFLSHELHIVGSLSQRECSYIVDVSAGLSDVIDARVLLMDKSLGVFFQYWYELGGNGP